MAVMQSQPYPDRALKIAQKAFEEFRAIAFWNWRCDTKVSYRNLPEVMRTLRTEGGRKGYFAVHAIQKAIAEQGLCEPVKR
jgi:hypothetical protein